MLSVPFITGRLRPVAISLAALAAILAIEAGSTPLEAQSARSGRSPAASGVRETPRAMLAIVSLRRQTIEIYDASGQITRAPISSGQSGYETPRGVFSVIQKEAEHYSNLYDDAPMPFMQRLTWSGVALHAGNLPGYPASHGCIRMPYEFAERLFGMTQMGMRVIVTGGETQPHALTHASLMVPISIDPTAVAVAGDAAAGTGTTRVSTAFERTDSATLPKPMRLGAALGVPSDTALPPLMPSASPLSASGRYLDAARADASAELAVADRQLAAAKAEVARIVRANAATLRSLQAAERALAEIDRRLALANTARERARNDIELVKAEEAVLTAEVDRIAAAERVAALSDTDVAAAKSAAETRLKAVEDERAAKAKLARDLDRKARPISVLISRKTQRLYIRQGFEPVLDMPIEIRDPSRPIGTHVFTAMATTYEPATATWHAVTVIDPAGRDEPQPRPARKGEQRQPLASAAGSASASAALDRVVIPDDVSRRIGESLRAGASIMISDEGISPETGKGTDFILLTR